MISLVRRRGGSGVSRLSLAMLGAGLLIPGVAHAEAEAASPAADTRKEANEANGDIIVTAQTREQRLQDVPISISVISGNAMKERGVVSSLDLARVTPGLTFESAGLLASAIYMRGIGSYAVDVNHPPSVAVFVDGIYVPRPNASTFSLLDVERVEVLKGPQGALFGRNTEGGAISIVSRKPTQTMSGFGEVQVGNRHRRALQASISGPLVGDRLFGRLSGSYTKEDGEVRNLLTGKTANNVNNINARGVLEYRGDDVKLLVSASHDRDRLNGYATINLTPSILFLSPASPFYNSFPVNTDPKRQRNDETGYTDRDETILTGKMDVDVGFATLSLLTGYFKYKLHQLADSDGVPILVLEQGFDQRSKTISQEVRLVSNLPDLPIDWIIGGFYSKDKAQQVTNYEASRESLIGAQIPVGQTFRGQWRRSFDIESLAMFGQVGINFTDKLRLQAGLRIGKDSNRNSGSASSNIPTALLPAAFSYGPIRRSWSYATPQISLQYRPVPALNTYVSYSEGFKSGGFQRDGLSPIAAIPVIPFNPEKVESYEVGAKVALFQGRLRMNAAFYRADYSGLQLNQAVRLLGVPRNLVTNAGASRAKGGELEIQAQITPRVDLSGGYSYSHARFRQYIDPANNNLAGRHIPFTPTHTANLAASYSLPIGAGTLRVGGDASYQSTTYFEPFNYPAPLARKGYVLLGSRISHTLANGLQFALWGKNLTNHRYCSVVTVSLGVPGAPPAGICQIPQLRSYGASASIKF